MSTFDLHVGTCGCCEAPSPGTPESIFNRPSLDEINYRVGRYPTFRQAMIQLIPELGAKLARREGLSDRPLTQWTSRESDDYGIAFIEMWATIGDILTFYQERYANYAWLRTAPSRDEVRMLADLLGYRLRPGVAAATHLSFRLEDDARVTIPAGIRAQSVPKEGETPQKFEGSDALNANASLNRVRVYGKPLPVTPLAANRTAATLESGSHVPVPRDKVLLFTNNSGMEERTVERVDVVDGRDVVRWNRPLGRTSARAFILGRTFRLFGHSTPTTWLKSEMAGSAGTSLKWTSQPTTHSYDNSYLHLEGTPEGVEEGSKLLVDDAGSARYRTVSDVRPAVRTVGPLTGPSTQVTISSSINRNVRTAVVHELLDELEFQDWEVPETALASGSTKIYVPYPEVKAVDEERLLILDDKKKSPMLVEAAEDAVPYPSAASAEYLEITLDTGTSRSLDSKTVFLLGNIAKATHGETISVEILGDGNTAETLQSFTLKKDPVTHVADPRAVGGSKNTLQVFVEEVLWKERSGLFGAKAGDRVYVTEIDDEQKMTVRFGDGRTGSRLPTGKANVVATYRQGIGKAGNVAAGQITTALERPVGLKEVTNPLSASGGVNAESIEAARENAPNTVRTFGRAVSLRDFADLAREFSGIAKALSTWVWDGEERVVHVTVGGEDGAALGSKLTELRTYLDLRRDPNRALRLGEYNSVPFVLNVKVEAESDRFNVDVAESVRDETDDYFLYDNRKFGQAVHLSDLYGVIHEAEGVVSALITELRYKNSGDIVSHGVGAGPVLVHAPILGARHDAATRVISPAEIATVAQNADVVISVSGGLVS